MMYYCPAYMVKFINWIIKGFTIYMYRFRNTIINQSYTYFLNIKNETLCNNIVKLYVYYIVTLYIPPFE